jgi:hypothetical protein
VVRRPAALLALFVALLGALALYNGLSSHLWHEGIWWDVAWIGLVLMPATFGLVLLALPYRNERWAGPAGLALAVLSVVLTAVDANEAANFARLFAATLIAWWFLGLFETLSWVVIVACIIPWVDAYSVWRGPTKSITEHHPNIFNKLVSYAFPPPGRPSPARLGVPDLLFFALFLGAAARFGLRVYWTWACMIAGLAITIALTVWWDISGLPALPAIALGFLAPNADLIWKRLRLRGQPGIGDRTDVALDASPDDA